MPILCVGGAGNTMKIPENVILKSVIVKQVAMASKFSPGKNRRIDMDSFLINIKRFWRGSSVG